jgi:hypothetical protein
MIVKALAFALTMGSSENLLRSWATGNIARTSRVRFYEPILDVSTETVATARACFHGETLSPKFYKRAWGTGQRQRVFVGRDHEVRVSDYDPHLNAHMTYSPEARRLTEAMPLWMDKGLTVLCSQSVLLNGTMINTERTLTCGDVHQGRAILGTIDGTVLVYDVASGVLLNEHRTEGKRPVMSVRWASHSLFATGHTDGTIRVHTMLGSFVRQVCVKTYHTNAVVRIRTDSMRMASMDSVGTIHVASPVGNRVWWSQYDAKAFDIDKNKLVVAARDSVTAFHVR